MPPNSTNLSIPFFIVLLSLSPSAAGGAKAAELSRTFIVIVDPQSKPYIFSSYVDWYSSLTSMRANFHHLYSSLVHGFSASLTLTLARRIESSPGVLSVHEDYALHPQTTRSPAYLGLDSPYSVLSNVSDLGSESIIGVIDTGIWPESPSFFDDDLSPIPKKWTGQCEAGERFNRSNCNRKLIGARYFTAGYSASFGEINRDLVAFLSARDSDGHGTHVASIAAGSPVAGANFYGFAGGIARGMAPKARIAAYKVCWASGCLVSDIVSAVEKAVSDGVDIISLSLGSSSPAESNYRDPLSIATFRATLRGVFITASAGNGGPHSGSVGNAPPWITTVGAATIDRDFPAIVRLGNGEILRGNSISIPPRESPSGKLTVASMGNVTSPAFQDRIVYVEADGRVSRIETGVALKRGGATAMIIFHGDMDPKGLVAEPHVIPTTAVGASEARSILRYIDESRDPTAEIFSEGTDLLPRVNPPFVASFSSQGPNPATPWILKPDLVAPGVNILGAWAGSIGPSGVGSDIRRSGFNVMSGTSMACPHVSGVAALIRAARPDWGPSEIRSALMTTAVDSPIRDESGGGNAGPFAFGSGYLNPDAAADPGLVYDLEHEDYIGFLCRLGHGEKDITTISGRSRARCERFGKKGVWGFNYPGFVVQKEELARAKELVFYRRLKRVDDETKPCLYRAEVSGIDGYTAEVRPRKLWFNGSSGERKEFRLILRWDGNTNRTDGRNTSRGSGMLRWRDEEGKHVVRSPIVVFAMALLNE